MFRDKALRMSIVVNDYYNKYTNILFFLCAVDSLWSIVPDCLSYLTHDASTVLDADEGLAAIDSK